MTSGISACLRDGQQGCTLSVKAQPRASRTGIAGLHGDFLKIRVAAPPVDSAANDALIEYLAAQLGIPRGSVRLIQGRTSTRKVFQLEGMTASLAAEKLGEENGVSGA